MDDSNIADRIVLKLKPLSSPHTNKLWSSDQNVSIAAILLSGVVAIASLINLIPSYTPISSMRFGSHLK
jgi:hypothetical protein